MTHADDANGVSPARRQEVVDSFRRGTVPRRGLDVLAVGLGHLDRAFDAELDVAAAGGAGFKAIRGEYGSGKLVCTEPGQLHFGPAGGSERAGRPRCQ